MPQYAEVILPLPIYNTYTYAVPPMLEGQVKIGCRVLVQFGRKKYYTAIVRMIHNTPPEGYEVKELMSLLDDTPLLRHPQLKLWEWISEYYLCPVGDVYKAAVPSGLKIESETWVSVNPDFEETDECELNERERVIYDLVSCRDRVQLGEITRSTGFRNVEATVSRMLEKEAIFVSEKVIDTYRPKTETFVTLPIEHGDSEGLHRLFDMVGRSKKQEQLLLAFIDLSHWLQKRDRLAEVKKQVLLERADVTRPVLAAAVKKGLLKLYKKEINRYAFSADVKTDLPVLTDEQSRALGEILDAFRSQSTVLLHGVTSSGKTSVYMHLIDRMLQLRRQVLYLVPEIALTTQLTQRLHRVFGDRLIIYHSKFSDNERVDAWKKLLHSSEPCIVIGVRSSVFLPFSNLGLVIIDEEHDTSYKQQEPAPRYNGRNVAMMLAMMHGAKSLLGSATPAVETYYKAVTGKFGLVEMPVRYEGIEMPVVEVINMKDARRKHEVNGFFSNALLTVCRESLKAGEQVILFQNRRGYAPMVTCKQCGWVPKCENCDVSLTYHKHTGSLSCHYCGYSMSLPAVCPACGQPTIEIVGFGTERVEDNIAELFSDSRIARMDLDTTRNKNSYEKIIEDFSERKSDILVGTQMVSKGLDFAGVSTVGILNADTMINFPDFLAHERAFNMMEQVAGRAGRSGKQGRVLIQTYDPENPVIRFVTNHDYGGFYADEIAERERYGYPPFTKIINVYLKHREDAVVGEMAVRMSNMMRQVFKQRVLGPEAPAVRRIQNLYIRQIVLKMENTASMSKVKQILRLIYENMLKVDSRMKSTFLYFDVDPV